MWKDCFFFFINSGFCLKGGGGGGGFGDGDLFDVSKGNYEPDGGKSKGETLQIYY